MGEILIKKFLITISYVLISSLLLLNKSGGADIAFFLAFNVFFIIHIVLLFCNVIIKKYERKYLPEHFYSFVMVLSLRVLLHFFL